MFSRVLILSFVFSYLSCVEDKLPLPNNNFPLILAIESTFIQESGQESTNYQYDFVLPVKYDLWDQSDFSFG